jgi:hypothetical protein
MKNAINLKDINLIKSKKTNKKTEKKRTYYDRLNDAVETGFSYKKDEIIFNKEHNICILKFVDVALISHNDILRINFKVAYKYIKLWKDRVQHLVKKSEIPLPECFNENKVIFEFLIKTNHSQTLDYDSSVACLKFIVDGVVKSKLIKDDSLDNIPLMLTKQQKVKNEPSSIYLVISTITDKEVDSHFSNMFKTL